MKAGAGLQNRLVRPWHQEGLRERPADTQIVFLPWPQEHDAGCHGADQHRDQLGQAGRRVGDVREDISISYGGAGYEIGRGKHFYGIWTAGATQSQPMEWWPDTPEGWSGAWARFISIEAPGTIVPVAPPAPPPGGPARPLEAARTALAGASPAAVLSAGLLALGVVLGIAGLFPGYVAGARLGSPPD